MGYFIGIIMGLFYKSMKNIIKQILAVVLAIFSLSLLTSISLSGSKVVFENPPDRDTVFTKRTREVISGYIMGYNGPRNSNQLLRDIRRAKAGFEI